MLNVSTQYKQAYIESENLHKELLIQFMGPGRYFTYQVQPEWITEVRNDEIIAESFELEQHLCDGEVDFVGCVSSTCKFTLAYNIIFDIQSAVRVKLITPGIDNNGITLFTGFVNDFRQKFTDGEVEYTCYDMIGMDFFVKWKYGDWLYQHLEQENTWYKIHEILSDMANKRHWLVFENYDINHLPNRELKATHEIRDVFKSMTAVDMLKYICQINGVFGLINNEGEFEFRQINESGNMEGTYPSSETYPSETLYPGLHNAGQAGEFILLPYESYDSDMKWQEEDPVNGVLIMETERDDIDKSSDNRRDVQNYSDQGLINISSGLTEIIGGSIIKIVGNPFVHDLSSSMKLDVCDKIQLMAGGHAYYEYEAVTKGMPFLEVGDYVDFIVTDWNASPSRRHRRVSCLISNRVLKGIQHMTDTFSAQATDPWKRKEESLNYIFALSPCTNVEESMEHEDNENMVDDKVDETVDEKLAEVSNIWNVRTVDDLPSYADPLTIYFIRGMVVMHGHSETTGGGGYDDSDEPEEPEPGYDEPINMGD